jgi:sulfur relay protein TusB/DsrH
MLIILSKSSWVQDVNSVLEIAKKTAEKGEKVAVIHIQDACIDGTMNNYCEKLSKDNIELYALRADCEARGLIEKMSERVRLVDYKQWVRLVMNEQGNVVSWTS